MYSFLLHGVRIVTMVFSININIFIHYTFYRNTDKMTDAEKIPIAIAGIAFITLPFLAGMIALYAAK